MQAFAGRRALYCIMPVVINAVEQYATLGEIADVLRKVYGEYRV